MVYVSGRASRNTWVSVGPLGLLILSPFFMIYFMTVWPWVAITRAIIRSRRRKAARLQPMPRYVYLDAVRRY